MKLFLSILVIFILFATPACKNNRIKEEKSVTNSQIEIEKVKLTNLNGEAVDMRSYKAKTVFINFWATWCKPCLEEMPTIKNMMDSLRNKNIEFLFASDESSDQIQSFESEHDYKFNYLIADNMEELNIMGLPTTFIFDKDGKLIFSEMNYRKWDEPANIDLILKIADQK